MYFTNKIHFILAYLCIFKLLTEILWKKMNWLSLAHDTMVKDDGWTDSHCNGWHQFFIYAKWTIAQDQTDNLSQMMSLQFSTISPLQSLLISCRVNELNILYEPEPQQAIRLQHVQSVCFFQFSPTFIFMYYFVNKTNLDLPNECI